MTGIEISNQGEPGNGAKHTLRMIERFRQGYTGAHQGCWRHECVAVSALEAALPIRHFSATVSCGEAAFYALFPETGRGSDRFDRAFAKEWTNRRDMEGALTAVGSSYTVLRSQLPTVGMALIEWTGSWKLERFWGSDLRRTHWVAVVDGLVFDVNWGGWLPKEIWEDVVVSEIIAQIPGATGWQPHTGYDLA